MRILVVDDSSDTADTLCRLLKIDGHDARVAYDGPEALIAVSQHAPDIVFLDLSMPGMDGFEVAQRIRKERGLDKVILVAMTSHGLTSDVSDSLDSGFDHHFTKPTPYPTVKALVDRIACERQRVADMDTWPTYSVIGTRQDGSEVVAAIGLSHEDACITRDLLCMSDKSLIDVRAEQEPASDPQ